MSMLFEKVAPPLPAGWRWADAEWRVDTSGLEADAVDAEGWSYNMDFRCVCVCVVCVCVWFAVFV